MNGSFGRKSPQQINAEIEEALRRELGLTAPLAFTIEDKSEGRTGRDMLLSDVAATFVGGSANRLYALNFMLPGVRPTFMQITLLKFGVGTVIGTIFFASDIAKPIAGEVMLENPKTFGSAQFVGEAQACAKLNTQPGLCKRADTFARTNVTYGGAIFRIERLFKLQPQATGTRVVATTLPKPPMLGGNAVLFAQEFITLVGLLETAL